jgi:hypothetical protein
MHIPSVDQTSESLAEASYTTPLQSGLVRSGLTLVFNPSSCCQSLPLLKISLAESIGIGLGATVERRPLGIVLKQAHGLGILQAVSHASRKPCHQAVEPLTARVSSTHVGLVSGEAVVDAGGHDHEIVLIELDADPVVVAAAYVEEAAAVEDIADLLILVQVLVEEHAHLLLIHVAHLLGRDDDLVAVLVRALGGEPVDVGDIREVEMQDAQLGQVVRTDLAAGVVGETLVTLGMRNRRSGHISRLAGAEWEQFMRPPGKDIPPCCRTNKPSFWDRSGE